MNIKMSSNKYRYSHKKSWTRLVLLLWLLQICKEGNTAPTKHLKITASGVIPKLIVTSEEDIGEIPNKKPLTKSKNMKTGVLPKTTIPTTISTTILTTIPTTIIEEQSTPILTSTEVIKTATFNGILTEISKDKFTTTPESTTTTTTTFISNTQEPDILSTTNETPIQTSRATETSTFISTTTKTTKTPDTTTTTITDKPLITTTTNRNLDIMLNEQPGVEEKPEEEEEAVKLLDLEQTNLKPLKKKVSKISSENSEEYTDGHDGIKNTKKKQLQIDTNILSDVKIGDTILSNSQKKLKLGPIYMEEKSYTPKLQKKKKVLKKIEPTVTATTTLITTPPKFSKPSQKTTEIPYLKVKETESKISDIQVEVFDSNTFKTTPLVTEKPLHISPGQHHFTQYVVDRVESSTYQPLDLTAANKPIPAAIEIHINVSEGVGGNEGEDLEFSYPQIDEKKNKSEVLLVEIIDNDSDNSTENSSEHINPIFTFQSNSAVEELKPKTDELFMVSRYTTPAIPKIRQPNIDRDSDTIFYISNTEVKVGESQIPIKNSYKLSTQPNIAKTIPFHHYEEDILLSPLHDTTDALKIFRNTGDVDAPPLDVTYVGESVMEVEQSPIEDIQETETSLYLTTTTTISPSNVGKIVIQPASLSDIGVPVIGELPPQIELKEFDFMPDEFPNSIMPTTHNEIIENDVSRLLESSVQYGADLIDEGAVDGNGGFETSYPFGNKRWHEKSHVLVNHLRKDVLNVELSNAEITNETKRNFNDTIKDLEISNHNISDSNMNVTYVVAERISNATASIMEDPNITPIKDEYFMNFLTILLCVIIAILPITIMGTIICALRYLYCKYTSNTNPDCENEQSLSPKHTKRITLASNGNGTITNTENELLEPPATPEFLKEALNKDISYMNSPTNTTNNTIIFNFKPSICGTKKQIQTQQNDESWTYKLGLKKPIIINSVPISEFKGPNGSITKMTMKNNHLIVETEERHDMSRNARETKMHYNNLTGKDGVFVVEVSRGIDSQAIPESPMTECQEAFFHLSIPNTSGIIENEQLHKSQEEVQIHQPPREKLKIEDDKEKEKEKEKERTLQQIDEDEEENLLIKQSNTGLSQSDLSSTSSSNSNKRYAYGNQELYTLDTTATATTTTTITTISPNNHSPQNETMPDDDSNKPSNIQLLQNSPSNDMQKQKMKEKEEQEQEKHEEANENKYDTIDEKTTIEENNNIDKIEHEKEEEEETTEDERKSTEIVFDSLLNLPEPPNCEEMQELSDCGIIDVQQLDSLPPPSPPPPLHLQSIQTSLCSVSKPIHLANNQLTPPASPPVSPPATYCNVSNGLGVSLPMAVNVNGS